MRPRRNARRDQHQSFSLEDYRSGKYSNLNLADIISQVIAFAKNRDGSKFMQRKLDDACDNRKNSIFNEMEPHLFELMMDPYGNFVVQKFFEVGNDSHRQTLLSGVRENLIDLCMNKYGCRVVQKAVETGTMQQQLYVLELLTQDYIPRVATDANGNHVIQKSFRCVETFVKDILFSRIEPYIGVLCTDLYGCRVIQCILEHGNGGHRLVIYRVLEVRVFELATDRFGNYVIQHALQFCPPANSSRLIEYILGNVIEFSVQKYASNVVEKCLQLANPTHRSQVMDTICSIHSEQLKQFCIELYANYVMQKLIVTATREQVMKLYSKLGPHFDEMRRRVCGRRIITKIQRRLSVEEGIEQLNLEFQQLLED